MQRVLEGIRGLRERDDSLASWLLFLVPLGILIARRMLNSTGYSAAVTEIVTIDQVRWFVFGIIAVREVLYGRYDKKACATLAVFAVLGAIAYHADYRQLIDALVFAFAARNLEFRAIALFCFVEILLILLVVLGSVYLGVIADVVYQVQGRGDRHSLGFSHPNGSGAFLLCCILLWTYIRGENFGLGDAAVCVGVMLALFQFTVSRGSLLAAGVLLVALLAFRLLRGRVSSGGLFAVGTGSVCLAALASIALCLCYSPDVSWMGVVNSMLSGRISLGHDALELYGVTLLGQNVLLGHGMPIVDNLYVRLLVKCGVLFTVVSVALVIVSLRHFTAQPVRAATVIAIVIALAVYGMVEVAPGNVFMNPFLLLLAVPFGVRSGEGVVRASG